MPSTPSSKQIQLDQLSELVDINTNLATVIANQGADSANIAAITASNAAIQASALAIETLNTQIAAAQVIREQLQRIQYEESSLTYKGKFGSDAEILALDTDESNVPTQV